MKPESELKDADGLPNGRRSRREFLGAAGGAATGALLTTDGLLAQAPGAGIARQAPPAADVAGAGIPAIKNSTAFTESLATAPRRVDFTQPNGITGAQVLANLCKDEDLAVMFCMPGDYITINAIAAAGIPCYGGRSEGTMAGAADGFSRVTGEVTACSGGNAPGFTNMLMFIAQAHRANTPLLVLAGNASLDAEDSFRSSQMMMQQSATEDIRKWGKRIIQPERIYEYGSYAFRHLKTGVPGVVHLDLPDEIQSARWTDPSKLTAYHTKSQYRSESVASPTPKDVARAVELINKAERPLVFAGHGVSHRKAWEPLMRAVEKNEMAVCVTGPVAGHFPDDHRLSASMQNSAMMSADLVVFVGQYCMPVPSEWSVPPGVKTIRVHPEGAELGRTWPLELGVVSDERLFLEALADGLPAKKRDAWVAELAANKAAVEKQSLDYYALGLKYSEATNRLHPAVIAKETADFLYRGNIDPKQTVTGQGGQTMSSYAGRWLRANRPGQRVVTKYQLGAMGCEIPIMLGATAAVNRGIGPQSAYKGAPAIVLCGDMGAGYGIMEMETAAKYKLPLITIVYNNNAVGTFRSAAGTPGAMHMYMFQENLRYDKIAEGLGVRGEYVLTPAAFKAALARAWDAAVKESAPSLINAQGLKEFSMANVYPPGVAYLPAPSMGDHRH